MSLQERQVLESLQDEQSSGHYWHLPSLANQPYLHNTQ